MPMSTYVEPPGAYTLQQLKSVRDDLTRSFRENDKAILATRSVAHLSGTKATTHRVKRMKDKANRIAAQICALTITISYLETKTK